MQKIKLAVIDIDATLVEPYDTEISAENIEAVKLAQKNGVLVTLATGRLYASTKKWVEALGIDMPVVVCNGAGIMQDGTSIYTRSVGEDVIRRAVDCTDEWPVRRYLFSDEKAYCTPRDRDEALFEKWTAGGNSPVRMMDSFGEIVELVGGNVQKMLMWTDDMETHAALLDALRDICPGCELVTGEPCNLEIVAGGVTKEEALRRILDMYDISMREVLAIGDSGNDVELLREAGIGVAVKNAMPEAKRAADYEVASCAENGVAEALRRFALPI